MAMHLLDCDPVALLANQHPSADSVVYEGSVLVPDGVGAMRMVDAAMSEMTVHAILAEIMARPGVRADLHAGLRRAAENPSGHQRRPDGTYPIDPLCQWVAEIIARHSSELSAVLSLIFLAKAYEIARRTPEDDRKGTGTTAGPLSGADGTATADAGK